MLIGGAEILLLLALVAVVFGGGKLPEVLGSVGKAYKEFKQAEANPDGPPSDEGGKG